MSAARPAGAAEAVARAALAEHPAARDPLSRALDLLDRALVVLCVAAAVASGAVLTYSVMVRHLLHWSTDWQDEVAVFLLVGATFLSAPYVQARRGHIGIEAVRGLLGPRLERVRVVVVDLVCLVFTAGFAFLCWELFLDAVGSGEVTDSTWAPPLWLPYGLMTAGVTLLGLRVLAQVLAGLADLAGLAAAGRSSGRSLGASRR